MKNTIKFALVGALLAVAAPVASADSYSVSKQAAKEITANPKQVLSIVAKQIAANKGSVCEIVKAAIVATEADKKQVAQIVEQAIVLVPNKASLITTCALAVAPDAHVEIMKVAAKYTNKSKGELAASAKNKVGQGKNIVYLNPLDTPIGYIFGGEYSVALPPEQVIESFTPVPNGPGNPYSQVPTP